MSQSEKIIFKDEVYVYEETELFNSYRPMGGLKKGSPTFRWKGPKMHIADWMQAVAFMAWVNKHDKSEAQLRFFVLKDENKIIPWAFPQEKNTGMTTKEITGPEQDRQTSMFTQRGGISLGTVHSHCNSSAFQSGVDTNDENNQDGMHITIGKLGNKDSYDIDHRFYYFGVKYNLGLEDWFCLSEELDQRVNDAVELTGISREAIFKKLLTQPLSDEYIETDGVFPKEWKDNLIVVPKPVTKYNNSVGYNQYPSKVVITNGKFRVTKGTINMLSGEIVRGFRTNPAQPALELFSDASLTTVKEGNLMPSEIKTILRLVHHHFPREPLVDIVEAIKCTKPKELPPATQRLLKAFKKGAKSLSYPIEGIRAGVEAFDLANDSAEEAISLQLINDSKMQQAYQNSGDDDYYSHNGIPHWQGSAHQGCFPA